VSMERTRKFPGAAERLTGSQLRKKKHKRLKKRYSYQTLSEGRGGGVRGNGEGEVGRHGWAPKHSHVSVVDSGVGYLVGSRGERGLTPEKVRSGPQRGERSAAPEKR